MKSTRSPGQRRHAPVASARPPIRGITMSVTTRSNPPPASCSTSNAWAIRGADQKPLPSWLELKRDEGTWRAAFVGRWGNARPLPTVAVQGDKIRFVSPKQEEGSTNDLVFEGGLVDGTMTGSAQGPNGTAWSWRGKRAPALKRSANVKWSEPIRLFNGTNFSGWTFDNPAKSSSWVVDKGCLVNQSAGSNIATERRFQDFKLHIEVNCPTKANSGIYLRGRYEVQVEDSYGQPVDPHHMGGIYSRITPLVPAEKPAGEWQTFDITLVDRHVTVVLNGKKIIDNQPLLGCTGGALWSDESRPGPIYLQGDHTGVNYRNIVLKPVVK